MSNMSNEERDINSYCDKLSKSEINPFLLRNPELREMYDKGLVVFADGYFVATDEKYVYTDDQGKHLTEKAKNCPRECVIGIKESKTTIHTIHHGIPTNDLVQNNKKISKSGFEVMRRLYDNAYQKNDDSFYSEAEDELREMIHDKKRTFCDCLSFLMEKREWKSVNFHEITGLNQDYFSKIKRNDYTKMDLKNLLIICISLRVNRELIELILGKAGYKLRKEDKDEQIYLDILSDYQYLTIDEFDKIAESKGAKPLQKEEKEDRVRSKTKSKNGI